MYWATSLLKSRYVFAGSDLVGLVWSLEFGFSNVQDWGLKFRERVLLTRELLLFVCLSVCLLQIMDGDGGLLVATSPPNTGRNSLWKAHVTNPEIKERKGVVLVTICFASSGALSFVDYYTEREHDEIVAQPKDGEYSGKGDSAEGRSRLVS